jgi:hypothetical protein
MDMRTRGQDPPTGRAAEMTDLDGTMLFLASRASDYVNGHMVFRGRGVRGRMDGPGVTPNRRGEP